MYEGIWLGVNGRTEEVFIGTRVGVAKCRTVKRLPGRERWDAHLLHEMQGTTWQPVPGYKSDHVPVEISEDSNKIGREAGDRDDDVDVCATVKDYLISHDCNEHQGFPKLLSPTLLKLAS